MKLVTVMDNRGGENHGLISEHGLSFYAEFPSTRVLFDFGPGKDTLANARKLDIPLDTIQYAVGSHGHYDHAGGYPAFVEAGLKAPLVTGKGYFLEKYGVEDIRATYLGTGFDEGYLKEKGIRHVECDGLLKLAEGVFLAMTLIPATENKNTLKWITEGVTNSAGILAITGAGGSFGAIIQQLPIADVISSSLMGMGVGVFLPFIIAALLKCAMGASTVAMITTSAMVAPMLPAMGFTSPLGRVLIIMAIGAGSMTVSHANDSYFWVVSQFSDMSTSQAYKCQTGMTGVMGIVTIVVVYILSLFLV
nr:MBL fold metallo-hydrolase [Acidaminococcus timonensis]